MKASACSKVLLTGAYLIIDPKYSGLVLATDARFHTTSRLVKNPENSLIKVKSNQFKLEIHYDGDGQVVNGDGNGFLNKCIKFMLEILKIEKGKQTIQMDIELSGDNAFYS